MIRLSESRGANPLATVASRGYRHHTRQEKPVAKITSTSFEVSLTAEEMVVIQQALDSFYNERLEAFGGILDSDDPALIAETLREEFKEATS